MKYVLFILCAFVTQISCSQNNPNSPLNEEVETTKARPYPVESKVELESPVSFKGNFESNMKSYQSVWQVNNQYKRIINDYKVHDYSANFNLREKGENMENVFRTYYDVIIRKRSEIGELKALDKTLYQDQRIKRIESLINNTPNGNFVELKNILTKYGLSKYYDDSGVENFSFNKSVKFESFKDFESFIYYSFGWHRYSLMTKLNNDLVNYLKSNNKAIKLK